MRVLFVSNYFPPEANAPAARLYEHAKHWVSEGAVDVLTAVPNFPEGEIYEGYKNELMTEHMSGISVTRVPMYIAENKGFLKRTLSYISFMISAIWYSRIIDGRPDIVVGSSPQFFSAVAGYVISKFKRAPFVLEVRDLWPDSIVAVGAMRRNIIVKILELLELYLYRKSDHIIVVTDSFKRIIEGKGISSQKISVIKNGADLEFFSGALEDQVLENIRRECRLEGKFVAAYIGTVGMAHRADILFEAAQRCNCPDIVFMVVGGGAGREVIERAQENLKLPNFRLVDKQPRDMVPYFLQLSDVSVVHLRNTPLFRTVIPSKIFESMLAGKPIALGVSGEAKEIVEDAHAGIPFTPEDAGELVSAVIRLYQDRSLYKSMATAGSNYVREHHDRKKIAKRYWSLIRGLTRSSKMSSP